MAKADRPGFYDRLWCHCMNCGEGQWWKRPGFRLMKEQPCSLCGEHDLATAKKYFNRRDPNAVRARRRALLDVAGA